MELFYTDEGIRETMGDIFWEHQEELNEIYPRHTVVGSLVRVMKNRLNERCLFEITNEGLLIVFMDAWAPRKARSCQYLKFSRMQGVQIKRGKLNYIITVQLADGMRCKLQIMKQSTKHLPNQRSYAEYMIAELERKVSQDIHYNTNYKKMRKAQHRYDFFYLITLFMILIPVVAMSIRQKSEWVLIGGMISAVLIHFMIFSAVSTLCNSIKGAGFRKEYQAIMAEYNKTQNAQALLVQLKQMQHQPKAETEQAAYAICLSTALWRSDRKAEALEYLNSIKITDDNLNQTLQQQKELLQREAIKDGIHWVVNG